MANGGYRIIDIKNVSIGSTAKKIAGVYDAINGTNKQLLLTNINIGGTKYHDTIIDVTVSSTKFVWTVYGYNFEVTTADNVKATAVV